MPRRGRAKPEFGWNGACAVVFFEKEQKKAVGRRGRIFLFLGQGLGVCFGSFAFKFLKYSVATRVYVDGGAWMLIVAGN